MYLVNARLKEMDPKNDSYCHTLTPCALALALTLGNGVRLDISVIVFAGPHKASFTFECLSHHVIYQSVLIPDTFGLKLALVLTAKEEQKAGSANLPDIT